MTEPITITNSTQNTVAPAINNSRPATFNPTVRYTFESRLVEAMIDDYWEYLLAELPARGLVNARELEYLKKSGLLGRFMSENHALINCFRLGCG
jgi:hypothetical protein